MSIHIDEERFRDSHGAFRRHMYQQSGGVTFTSFQHPSLVDHETAYKQGTYSSARKALNLSKWAKWKARSPDRIIEAVKAACRPNVSQNLLEHRYGIEGRTKLSIVYYRI